jgi:HSP20 family molecular chaperone IbpA
MRFYNGLDDIFNDYFDDTLTVNTMGCDIYENENQYLLSVALPGYSKEEVRLHLNDGTLTIDANKPKRNDGSRLVRRERANGHLTRSFYVGDALRETDIKATFVNGELNIVIPKNVEHKEEKKYIDIL